MRRTFLFLLLIFLNPHWGRGQTYPVLANLQFKAPYSTFLADYTAPGSDRLTLNVFLADLTRPDLQVRFRLTIEGAGILLTTKQEYIGTPFLLESGFPVQIYGEELVEYFRPENMDLLGITETQLNRTGALPEGIYNFSLEVLEYNRGVQISNKASSTAWLILNDPPIINSPYQNEIVRANDPQTVRFQWTPRHTGSPNAAFSTNYELKLVEIWPATRNPNDAMLTSSPLFVTEVAATSFIYGIGEPPLIPGRKYAYQVRAIAMTGMEQLDLFKNQGRSEVYAFTFGKACEPPVNITATATGNTKIKVKWDTETSASSVAVMYRVNEAGSYFFEEDSYIDTHTLYKLKQGTAYEIVLKSQCGTLVSRESRSVFVTTGNDTTSFSCGTLDVDFDLENKSPIGNLYPGDIIYAGDFDIKLNSVSGAGGNFSGSGVASFPFLNFVNANVVFEGVIVNTDYRMVDGNITTFYNPNSAMLIDLDSLGEQPGSIGAAGASADETADSGSQADTTSTTGWVPVDSVFTNTQGQVVVVANGEETIITLEPGEEKQFTDKDGNQITVSEAGISSSPPGNSGSAPSGQEATTADEFTFSLGPLVVHLNPATEPKREDGQCFYNDVEASFELVMADKVQQIDRKIKLDGGIFSLVRDCESGEILSLKMNWQDEKGYDIGKIAYLGAKVQKVHLEFSQKELLQGSVDLAVKNDIDVPLSSITVLRSGVTGKFGYEYDANSRDYSGTFNFGGIGNVNIDLLKADQVVASLKDGEFNKEGWLKGHMDLVSPVSYTAGGIDIRFTKFKSDIELSLPQGFSMISADIKYELTSLPGITGTLKGRTTVQNDLFSTTLSSTGLTAFGMALTDVNLDIVVDENLEFDKISGTLKAAHPDFGAALEVLDFEVNQGELVRFTCSGNVNYNQLAIRITQADYDPDLQLLRIDASVEQTVEGISVAAAISDFNIDMEGNISMGDYEVDISGVRTFGPLTVAMSAVQEGQKKNKWVSTTAEASFSLKLDGSAKELQITRAQISFEKKKNKSQYRNISISMKNGNIPAADIGPLQARLAEVEIHIIHDDDFISGAIGDTGNASIGEGSSLTMQMSLNDDRNLGGFLYLEKDVSGLVTYLFSGDGLKGTLDYGAIENINISARKGSLEFASLSNGTLDENGVLSGRVTALEGASFTSGSATVAIEQFELDIIVPFTSAMSQASILAGSGVLNLKNIVGVEGQFAIGLTYDDQQNFQAVVHNSSRVSAMGMTLSAFNIEVSMTETLDIQVIEGQMKARHAKFNADLTVNRFKIVNGELLDFSLEGKVNYNGFFLDINRADYVAEQLTLDGRVAINVTGTSAWLAVEEFTISGAGEITIKKVAGEFDKSPVLIKFSAGMTESRFKGSFTGELASIGLAGNVDIGVEKNLYNFAYLELTARTNILLGGTGLKLTKMGGQLGYNYTLVYKEGDSVPTGEPQEGNYIIGLTLGVADVGDMAELTGNPLVQFGKDHLNLTLNGNLKAPRENSILTGDMSVRYKLPANTLSGSVQASLHVPPQTGKAFKGEFAMDFNVASSEWAVSSTQIKARLLQEIDFTGSIDLQGKTGKDKITGYLSGLASYDFSKTYDFTMLSVDFRASVDAGFNFQGRINFDNEGFAGKVQLRVYVDGELQAKAPVLGYVKLIELSGDMQGSATFTNTAATLEGQLTLMVDVFGEEHSIDVNVTQTI